MSVWQELAHLLGGVRKVEAGGRSVAETEAHHAPTRFAGSPAVWGMEAISSSCEPDRERVVHGGPPTCSDWRSRSPGEATGTGGSDNGRLPICGRCRPGLPRGVGRHPPRWSGYDLVERDGLQRRRHREGHRLGSRSPCSPHQLLDNPKTKHWEMTRLRSPKPSGRHLRQRMAPPVAAEWRVDRGDRDQRLRRGLCVRTESDAPDHPPAAPPRPDQAASLAVDDSDRHGPRALCHSTALQAALINERIRSPEELHPVSAPNAGLGMRR